MIVSKGTEKVSNGTKNERRFDMSQKEQEIMEKLSGSISKANETQKEYLLGLADGMALMSNKEEQNDNE